PAIAFICVLLDCLRANRLQLLAQDFERIRAQQQPYLPIERIVQRLLDDGVALVGNKVDHLNDMIRIRDYRQRIDDGGLIFGDDVAAFVVGETDDRRARRQVDDQRGEPPLRHFVAGGIEAIRCVAEVDNLQDLNTAAYSGHLVDDASNRDNRRVLSGFVDGNRQFERVAGPAHKLADKAALAVIGGGGIRKCRVNFDVLKAIAAISGGEGFYRFEWGKLAVPAEQADSQPGSGVAAGCAV